MKVYQTGGETVGVSLGLAAVIVPGYFRVNGPVTERLEKARLAGVMATYREQDNRPLGVPSGGER